MPRKEAKEVIPISQHIYCDECGEGELMFMGFTAVLENPTMFVHQCNKCGVKYNLDASYPHIEHVQKIKNGD